MSKPRQKRVEAAKSYRDGLGKQERARYFEKLKLIGDKDTYELAPSSWTDDPTILPSISYPDIVNYLVFSPSPYTAEDLKCYKGLEAYNQMVCGWVREAQHQLINNDMCIVKAKVLHSQRIREKPLEPWVIAEKSGRILGAHCTCMVGLGETCTHVAALLFLIEATVKLRDSKTVTQKKAYWMLPTGMSKVEYKECREIDFFAAKTYKVK